MKTTLRLALPLGLALTALQAHADFTLTPLSSFGGGDGWLAPGEGEYAYLGTASNERGLAYGNGHLYLVSRTGGNNIRRLDPFTGADLGAPLNVTGISGGTFAVNMIGVAADGAIYVGNLANPVATGTPFKLYRWADESAAPTLAFSSTNLTRGRLGDTLDVMGAGTSTQVVLGESNNTGSGSRNGYAVLRTANGVNFTGSLVTFATTPPNLGDFRLGLTFTDAGHVLGTRGGTGAQLRYTSFSGSTGTLLGSATLGSETDCPMDYAMVGGFSLLATLDTTDSTVRIWDMADPLHPLLLATQNNTSGTLDTTGHGTGAVAWGPATENSATLWTMSANQGIQAFTFEIPEPGSGVLLLAGLGAWTLLRRQRR